MKIKQHIFLLLTALFFMASACKTTEQGSKIYNCTGSNPFWKVEIGTSGIIFSLLGKEDIKYPYKKPVEVNNRKLFVTSKEIGGKKSWLKVSIAEATCSTSSAGRKFPLKVEVDKDGEVFYGCGE